VSDAAADRDSDGRFAVLASERPYAGKIVTVRIDEVAMPGGGSARREVVEHVRAVGVVAIDSDGRVVLIEQYRHPFRRRLWELPAGLMDIDGEPPATCAARELAEEVGLAADRWSVLVDLATSPGFCTESIRVYLAQDLRAVPSPPAHDEEADIRVVRVPLDEAVDAALAGRIVNATAVAGLLAAARALAGYAAGGPRPADDPWTHGPALVHTGARVADAPDITAPSG
jgi:ADP-ribose pyrophosphatase